MGTEETKRTLIFPPPLHESVGPNSVSARELDAAWDAMECAAIEELSSGSVIPDDPDFEEEERPSGRKTIPTELAPNSGILSSSDLEDDESERALATTRPPPAPPEPVHPTLKELAFALERAEAQPRSYRARGAWAALAPQPLFDDESTQPIVPEYHDGPVLELTPSSIPPISVDMRPPLTSMPGEMARSYPVPSFPSPRTAALFAASNFAVGMLVLATMYSLRPEPKPAKRTGHIAIDDRTPLGDDVAAGGSTPDIAPLEGCKVQDLARLIATRAELGPGLDASALESGFGVGLAATMNEAVGVRLDADTLHTAETIRLRTPWPFAHVTVDQGDDPDLRMDVHVDNVYARKGGVFARDGRLLWPLPGAAPRGNEPVRAALRVDGTAVVAVRRPGHFWVGIEGSGPLTAIMRPRKQLGMPAVAATYDGGVVAWAERGASQFSIYGATLTIDGKRTTVGPATLLAEGMSPSIARLPSGELLLTYADGSTGAHRVVARRLGAGLDPRGDLLVVSSDVANAGQPAVAVDSDGRAIVAFAAFEHGRAEVHATQLLCR